MSAPQCVPVSSPGWNRLPAILRAGYVPAGLGSLQEKAGCVVCGMCGTLSLSPGTLCAHGSRPGLRTDRLTITNGRETYTFDAVQEPATT